MPEPVDWIPDDDWATVVSNVPVVSVDLLVRTPAGVLLLERANEPARGEWFVPGGRVRKGERLAEAVHRVAREELGVEVAVESRLGVYEHLYDEADVPGAGGKHYIAVGFVVRTDAAEFDLDDQHGDARAFETPPDDLHPYVRAYLDDAGFGRPGETNRRIDPNR